MPDLNHKVTRGDFDNASKRFNELFNEDEFYYRNKFMQFLGFNDYLYSWRDHHIHCSELASRKIEMLNSPHAYALMKAFIARTGYHKKLVKR